MLKQSDGRILLYHVGGPLSFGAAKGMIRLLADEKNYEVLVLDLEQMPLIDFSAAKAIGEILDDTLSSGRKAVVVGANPKVHDMLEQQAILAKLTDKHVHVRRFDAMQDAEALLASSKESSR